MIRKCSVRPSEADASGFTLIEVVVSLLLLSIVSAASLALFVQSLGAGDMQAERQKSIELANLQMEQIRAVPVMTLVNGRTQAQVNAIWAAPPPGVDNSQSVELWDPTAAGPAVIPVQQTQLVDGVSYTVTTYIDTCYRGAVGDCAKANPPGTTAMRRVTVAVTWDPGRGMTCGTSGASGCAYVTGTLLDPSADPVFNSN